VHPRTLPLGSLSDGIAFQTNILALNAAVEAARAKAAPSMRLFYPSCHAYGQHREAPSAALRFCC
jgi:hypothetical protein